MYKRDGMSATECLTLSARSQRLEPDNEEGRWVAVLTAECGFFSAACLQRLFLRDSFGVASAAEDQIGGRRAMIGVQPVKRRCHWSWFPGTRHLAFT
jgi:hypothetical protein